MPVQVITMPQLWADKSSGRFSESDSRALLYVVLTNLKTAFAGVLDHKAQVLTQLAARRKQGDVTALVQEYAAALEAEEREFLQALARLK